MTTGSLPKAFVVDDEVQIVEICDHALGDAFDVQGFNNPVKALAAIEKDSPPDVIITDIRMPELSGLELLGRLRKDGYDMPVIVITGFADRDDAVKSLNLGAFAMIDKPFSLATITLTVHRAVAFSLMRKNLDELRPRYMFLADSLHEWIDRNKQQAAKLETYVETLSGEAKIAAAKVLDELRPDDRLSQMLVDHEASVASLHAEEDRLNHLLKVLLVEV